MDIKKEIKTRVMHRTTIAGLALLLSAVLHFFGIITVTEQREYVVEVSGLLALLGVGGVISKDWGKI